MKVREARINNPLIDLTPVKGQDSYPWHGLSRGKFKEDYSYVPVKITGKFDHMNAIYIIRPRDAVNGFEVITPFITHTNKQNEVCRIWVDRGWIREVFRHTHRVEDTHEEMTIQGVLNTDEGKTKHSIPNDPENGKYFFLDLNEYCDLKHIPNSEARLGMIKQIKLDDSIPMDNKLIMRPDKEFCLTWFVTPERHQAYAYFWLFLSSMSIVTISYAWLLI